jgi:hypothetical protein
MSKYVALALFLTGTPAMAMDEGQMDAIIASCQAGQVCSCPRAKLSKISDSECHKPPAPDYNNLDPDSVKTYTRETDVYTKCMSELFYANLKIERYNEIYDKCKNREKSMRPSVVPDRKALNQELQNVKPLADQINRDNDAADARERARQTAIQEEATRQAAVQQRAEDQRNKESPPLGPQVAEREQIASQASAPSQFVGASLGLLKDCYIDKILGGGNMPVCLLERGYVMQGDMCQAHDVVNGRPAIICAGQYGTPAYLRRKQDWYAGPFQ